MNVKADNPLEYVHPEDVALVVCKAIDNEEAIGKVLIIGGGPSCQVKQRELLSTAFNALALNLPFSSHGEESFYTHWMDTTQSQRLLQFQSMILIHTPIKPLKTLTASALDN
ncbi:MAG: hypothetical protein HRU20_22160 [Pseudomonadales bacterium]|nr:hypothetical protein [Pseudomonadales bacterium]